MKWIRWEVDAQDHPVIYQLASALDVHPMQALGHFTALCSRFGQHREDGQADQIPDALLERWAGWTGRTGRFAEQVRELLQDSDTGQLNGWWRQDILRERAEKDRERHRNVRRKSVDVPQTDGGGSTSFPAADVKDVSLRSSSRKKEDGDSDAGFADAWAAYPKRPGNSRKAALKAWRARIAEGVDPEALLAGTRAYAAFVRAEGREGTGYVKQASTFYGPDEHYLSDYTVQAPRPRLTAEDEAAYARYLEDQRMGDEAEERMKARWREEHGLPPDAPLERVPVGDAR